MILNVPLFNRRSRGIFQATTGKQNCSCASLKMENVIIECLPPEVDGARVLVPGAISH